MNQFIKKRNFLLTHVTISKNNLKTHEDSLHGGKKFLWGLCAYLATYKSNIRTHIKSVHDGEKFPCESCDNLAPTPGKAEFPSTCLFANVKSSLAGTSQAGHGMAVWS